MNSVEKTRHNVSADLVHNGRRRMNSKERLDRFDDLSRNVANYLNDLTHAFLQTIGKTRDNVAWDVSHHVIKILERVNNSVFDPDHSFFDVLRTDCVHLFQIRYEFFNSSNSA